MNSITYSSDRGISSFITGVYGWMSCALTLTAISAYYVAATPALFTYLYTNPFTIFLLFFAQIILVIALSVFLTRLTFITALTLFCLYAILLGVTLSSLFFVYTTGSIVSTFLSTALMFGTMSAYGYITRTDLTTIGTMSIMALFGLILCLLINMYFQSERIDYIISAIGILVFTILTAYDTQKIKRLGQRLIDQHELMNKITLLGALTLYLDFINLFLFLLRFTGKRQQN